MKEFGKIKCKSLSYEAHRITIETDDARLIQQKLMTLIGSKG
jgi:hypothetical protein